MAIQGLRIEGGQTKEDAKEMRYFGMKHLLQTK